MDRSNRISKAILTTLFTYFLLNFIFRGEVKALISEVMKLYFIVPIGLSLSWLLVDFFIKIRNPKVFSEVKYQKIRGVINEVLDGLLIIILVLNVLPVGNVRLKLILFLTFLLAGTLRIVFTLKPAVFQKFQKGLGVKQLLMLLLFLLVILVVVISRMFLV